MLVTIINSTSEPRTEGFLEESYLLREGMGAGWEGAAAGGGRWWTGPLSLDMIGDSVFTILDDAAGLKTEEKGR